MFNKYIFTSFLLLASVAVGHTQAENTQPKKPNIIYILMDDLGYGDLGVLFQNERRKHGKPGEPFILTPHLDRLAGKGAVLTQYCAAPVCAPSRASLLLGVSQGHANVRDNQFDKALEDNYTLGNVLQKLNYTTAAIGKWGLQGKTEGPKWPAHPLKRGFDYYYGYIAHRDGHEHYPKEGIYRGPKEVWENYREVSGGLDKCYTGDLFTAKAKDFITGHVSGSQKDKPFFLYLAYDTPHAALELPTQAYPPGKGLNGGLKWLGKPGEMINTASGVPDSWIHPDYQNTVYDDDNDPATPDVSWPETYKRYATVVRRIDDQIGDINALLKDLGIEENTFLVFTSDNGPSKESYLPDAYVDFKPTFFHSFGPFEGIKRDVLEGGIRMPTIAVWPEQIPPNTVIAEPSISYDWLPTFTDAAGMPPPVRTDGVSLIPVLTGNGKQIESHIYVEYFNKGKTPGYSAFTPEHQNRKRGQMQMIRMGNFVGVRYNIQSADDDFEIFDIVNDTKQMKDLAGNATSMLQEKMKEKVLQNRIPDAEAPRPYDSIPIPALLLDGTVTGLKWRSYYGNYPWLAKVHGLTATDSGAVKDINRLLKKAHARNTTFLFEGFIKIPSEGSYLFTLKTNGNAFVRVHNAAVIDAAYGYSPGELRSTRLMLQKGFHPIKIYYQGNSKSKDPFDLDVEPIGMSERQEVVFVH